MYVWDERKIVGEEEMEIPSRQFKRQRGKGASGTNEIGVIYQSEREKGVCT